jgi:hypothetical protein
MSEFTLDFCELDRRTVCDFVLACARAAAAWYHATDDEINEALNAAVAHLSLDLDRKKWDDAAKERRKECRKAAADLDRWAENEPERLAATLRAAAAAIYTVTEEDEWRQKARESAASACLVADDPAMARKWQREQVGYLLSLKRGSTPIGPRSRPSDLAGRLTDLAARLGR